VFCPRCGKETFTIKEAVYDGFTRIGERVTCADCGQIMDAPEDPASTPKRPAIFTDADRSPVLAIFGEGENRVICRYCRHYLVNPFKQWCGHHNKEVEATDTCDDFAPKQDAL
jgi:ribosomal protein S27E